MTSSPDASTPGTGRTGEVPGGRTGNVGVGENQPGAGTLPFEGRVSRSRKLDPGRHALVTTAVSAAGQRSNPTRVSSAGAK